MIPSIDSYTQSQSEIYIVSWPRTGSQVALIFFCYLGAALFIIIILDFHFKLANLVKVNSSFIYFLYKIIWKFFWIISFQFCKSYFIRSYNNPSIIHKFQLYQTCSTTIWYEFISIRNATVIASRGAETKIG